MQPVLRWSCLSTVYKAIKNDTLQKNIFRSKKSRIINGYMCKSFHNTHIRRDDEQVATALRTKKPKSKRDTLQYFVDMKQVMIFALFSKLKNVNNQFKTVSFLGQSCCRKRR